VSVDWFVMKEDREIGPYSWEELLEMAGKGEVKPSDLVFNENLTDWIEAEQLEGLFSDNLTVPHEDSRLSAISASTPVPAVSSSAVAPARSKTLPAVLIVLAFLLLGGGVLAYLMNSDGSSEAEETGPATVDGEVIAIPQVTSPGGTQFHSLGSGRIPADFSRTTPADPEGDDPPPADPSNPQHSVYNVMINQPSPSILPVGTTISYSFNYTTNHTGNVRITGVPLYDGNSFSGVTFNPPLNYPTGRGAGNGFFTVRNVQEVDGFRIRMNAAGTDTVLHERVFAVDFTFTPLEEVAPPDPDPDPAPPEADPDPDPGAPEEPVPPVPPDVDPADPPEDDAPDPEEGLPGEPEWEEGPDFGLPGGLPGEVPANAIFNVTFDRPSGTYPINTVIRYTFSFTTSETDRVRIGGYPRDIDLRTASYMTTEEFTRPPHEGIGSGFFRVNTAMAVRRYDLHIFKADHPHELVHRELIDVNYIFE
jgi:hypothetical protein